MPHSPWLSNTVDPYRLRRAANILADAIREDIEKLNIHAIVVTGVSGMAMGGAVSLLTGLPLIVVRKSLDSCHSNRMVEYNDDFEGAINYIFLDDLISSGETVRRVVISMASNIYDGSKLVKIYLYHEILPYEEKFNGNSTYRIDNEYIPVFYFNN